MSNTQSPLVFIANMMNMTLATGIFTLPFSLYETGLFLGVTILIVISFISWLTSTYILEALAITNNLFRNENEVLFARNEVADSNRVSTNDDMTLKTLQFKDDFSQKKDLNQSLVSESGESKDNYYIGRRFEVTNIAFRNMPKAIYIIIALDICLYLNIGLTSNTIIASHSLQKIFSIMIYNDTHSLPSYYYYVIAAFFILTVLLLSLGNIASLRKFTITIMICRFAVIILIFGCCFYSIAKHGMSDFSEIPKFKIENVSIMMGNSIFFFMIHHSIPGIVDSFKPQKKLTTLLFVGFAFSLFVMISFGFVSLLAFSKYTDCDVDNYPCAIQDTFSLNFISVPVIGYIINFYPLFNLITSAMQLITLKNNFVQIFESFGSKAISFEKQEKNGTYYVKQFFLSLIVMAIPITVSLTLTDIQQIMKYFSSIFGFFLMILFPCVIVLFSRKKQEEKGLESGKLNKSFFESTNAVYGVCAFGACIAGLIIYGFFHSDVKNCVAQIQ